MVCGCSQKRVEPISASNFQMNTLITITIHDGGDQGVCEDVFDEIDRIEGILSAALPDSDLGRLAQNAGTDYIEVSDDTVYLINESRRFSELSSGAFDCTIGPLVSLWDIKEHSGHYPSEDELSRALGLIDYNDVMLMGGNRVMLKNSGMKADLGAIAKGYAADRAKELLLERGVKSAVINLGGNINLIGGKPDGSPFRIGVRDPDGGTEDFIGIVEISDKSLVSSGSFERYFIHEGKTYHHILDKKTGFPVENELMEATIITRKSIDGDGLSTSAFLLGLRGGLELIENYDGAEGIFITRDKKVYVTSGIGDEFTITSDEYELVS